MICSSTVHPNPKREQRGEEPDALPVVACPSFDTCTLTPIAMLANANHMFLFRGPTYSIASSFTRHLDLVGKQCSGQHNITTASNLPLPLVVCESDMPQEPAIRSGRRACGVATLGDAQVSPAAEITAETGMEAAASRMMTVLRLLTCLGPKDGG